MMPPSPLSPEVEDQLNVNRRAFEAAMSGSGPGSGQGDSAAAAVETYVTELKGLPVTASYNASTPVIDGLCARLTPEVCAAVHKLVLLRLIADFDPQSAPLRLPPSVIASFHVELHRIVKNMSDMAPDHYSRQNDLFLKDLAICNQRLAPIGPGVAALSGLPRSVIFKGGLAQFLKGLWIIYGRLGSHRPVFEIHTHLVNVREFTPEGWNRAYILMADLLEANPDVHGLFRGSWFFDPAIPEISPNLAYLQDLPLANGAAALYYADLGLDCGAFARSAKRRALYDEGKYMPKSYLLIWPRKALIAAVRHIMA